MSNQKIDTVADLLDYIRQHRHCDETKYPVMANMTNEQNLMFVINHLVLHMSKSVGKIAAECENFDHGNDFYRVNRKELETLTAKMVINVLQLAFKLGMSSEQLIAGVQGVIEHNQAMHE